MKHHLHFDLNVEIEGHRGLSGIEHIQWTRSTYLRHSPLEKPTKGWLSDTNRRATHHYTFLLRGNISYSNFVS